MPVSLNVMSEVAVCIDGLHADKSECCVRGGHVSGLMKGVHTIGVYMWRLRWLWHLMVAVSGLDDWFAYLCEFARGV